MRDAGALAKYSKAVSSASLGAVTDLEYSQVVLAVRAGYVSVSLLTEGNSQGTLLKVQRGVSEGGV